MPSHPPTTQTPVSVYKRWKLTGKTVYQWLICISCKKDHLLMMLTALASNSHILRALI